MGSRDSSIKKEQIIKFQSLIKCVHLNSIYISSINFNRSTKEIEPPIEVAIKSKVSFINEEPFENKFQLKNDYLITFKSKKEKVAKIEISYILYMSCDNLEIMNDALKDERVRKVFLNRQIPKFSWSFLRNDVEIITSKAGFKPFFLDLLK